MIFKREIKSHEITDGLVLRDDAPYETEPRYLTLLMKGLIVYLVVMGSMGCLLSSFTIPYNALLLHISVFAASLFSAFLYYTKVWENLGYLVMFVGMLGSAVMLRKFISSGFFAVVNIISERAAFYFDTEVVQGYAESISDRNVTVTIAFIYIGWVFAILLNAFISRQMKYFAVLFVSFFFLTVPFYLEVEPDMLYILMLMAGSMIVFVFRGGRHTPITPNDRRFEYRPKKRYINYVYSFRHHATMIIIVCLAVLVFGGIFQQFFNKYEFETKMRGKSAWKLSTENVMENIYKTGLWGLFNRYDSRGGLKSGILGGISAVSLDYETDLEVTYVPYSSDRFYLRSFTGTDYLPYENRWKRGSGYAVTTEKNAGTGDLQVSLSAINLEEETTSSTADALRKRYEAGDSKSAKARINIRNIAGTLGGYFPYYVDEKDSAAFQYMNYRQDYGMDYYPWLTDPGPVKVQYGDGAEQASDEETDGSERGTGKEANGSDGDKEAKKKSKEDQLSATVIPYEKMYLGVPKENVAAVDSLIEEAGLERYRSSMVRALDSTVEVYPAGETGGEAGISDGETGESGGETGISDGEAGEPAGETALSDGEQAIQAIQAIGNYYQENMPYTYQPGVTPRGEDFVNYFLTDSKKGFCAHFAAATTLILRRLGYQARYIEGYVIDPINLVEDAKVRDDLKVSDYYDGDNLMNTETKVVTVNVTDASAHAWVEVLVDGHWRVAEVTPWSDEEPPDGSFLERMMDFFSGAEMSGGSSSDTSSRSGGAAAGLDAVGRVLGYGFLILFILAVVAFIIFMTVRLTGSKLRYIRAGRSDRLVMDFHKAGKKAEKHEKTINYRDRIRAMEEAGTLTLNDKEREELLKTLEKAGFSGQEISGEEYSRALKLLKGK